MRDYGYEETEKILKKIEARIHKEYKKATDEVQGKLRDYLDRFAKKDETWKKWVNDAKGTPEHKKRLKEYQEWRTGQMAIGKRWQEMKETLAEDYHHTNEIARSITYGYMPEVYAINHNYGTFQVEKGSKVDTSYTLYDRQTVERLMRDNPQLLPDPGSKTAARIAAGKDIRWNKQQIQSVMMQGILQGKSIPALATSLAQTVGDKNRNSAIRNARTMTTGAQNAGRVDSYKRANDMGIKTRKQWLATLDGRTRHTHRQLDGEIVDNDDRFSNGCEFPGDPKGDASEIYNCRCSLIPAIKGHEIDTKNTDLRHNSKLEGMSYEEWKKGKATSNPITLPEEKAAAIKQAEIAKYKEMAQGVPVHEFTHSEKENGGNAEKTTKTGTSSEIDGKIKEKRGQIDTGFKGKIKDDDLQEFNKNGLNQIIKDTGYSQEEAQKFQNAIREYFGGDYEKIETSPGSDTTKRIIDGLSKMPAYNGSIYRGMISQSDISQFTSLKQGDALPQKGVLESWSSDKRTANSYASIVSNGNSVMLECENNAKGVGVQHLSKFNDIEAEVLVANPNYEVENITVESKYKYLKEHFDELGKNDQFYAKCYLEDENENNGDVICRIKVKEKN